MDGFDAFNTPHNGTTEEADPAAEFLAREQSNLAGLVDDNFDVSAPIVNGLDVKPEAEDNLFGTAGESELDSGFEMVNHSSLDASLATTASVPATVNGTSGGLFGRSFGTGNSTSPVPSSFADIPREEPEKLRRWREDQKQRLAKKDEEEERKKAEMKEAARKELEEWYASHDEQVAKNRTINRNAEKELVSDTEPLEPGTEWERIAKLCDFNPKGSKHQKDISRMRSIILQVKQTPPQPRKA